MADEKILKDELLSDEELEKVAGGNMCELNRDTILMRDLGLMKNIIPADGNGLTVEDFKDLRRAWAQLKISFIYNYEGYNEYYNTKGEEISRDLAIKIAIKRSNSTLNPYEYF